jgi:uncharacterized glyoxalase superfamily protein PhnB
MPIKGWDHLELYVGNAKQAAYFYERAFGFTQTAYAGPETGMRDRASYVLDQNDIRLVVTSGLRPDSEITRFACSHGDGVKDVALMVPSATEAYRQSVQRGARSVVEPHWVEDDFGRVELSAIATYGENIHTFVNRDDYAGPYLPGYTSTTENGAPATGIGLQNIDHVVGNVELGRMEHWVEFYERAFGMTELIHFSDEAISTEYSALMSKVMMDGEGKIKFPINEPAEGKRKGRECSTWRWPRTTSWARCRSSRRVGYVSSRPRLPTTTTWRTASARSTWTTRIFVASASSPTATRRDTSFRSSRRPRRIGRHFSSRSSSATARAGLEKAISRHCSRQSNANRPCEAISNERGDTWWA